MNLNHRSKAGMDAANSLAVSVALEGARGATGDATETAAPALPPEADMQVIGRAERRRFSSADKRRILAAADRCTRPGEIGALMRREGVYSSSLSTWRRQREAADLAALAPQKRGPKEDPHRAETQHIAQLTRDNQRLQARLDNALLVIEVQKKVAALIGLAIPDSPSGST